MNLENEYIRGYRVAQADIVTYGAEMTMANADILKAAEPTASYTLGYRMALNGIPSV